MTDITISIPDAVVTRVMDAVAQVYGYDAAVDGTEAEFAKATLITILVNAVVQIESAAAGSAAAAAATAAAVADIVLS